MEFTVSEDLALKRIDAALAELSGGALTRSMAVRLIGMGRVKLNGKQIKHKSYKVKEDDRLEVDWDMNAGADLDIEVVFEDEDLIVINKPAGILSHAKGKLAEELSVADWATPRVVDIETERSGIVHRLDRATSGVMVVAKNVASKSWLMKQFSDRNVHKKYLAIIKGLPEHKKFKVDMPIGRNIKRPTTFFVNENGKPAQTEVEVLETSGEHSLVLLSPKTGRTHQLRVHMWSNGWPIEGDAFYNENFKEGQSLMLHALSLTIQIKKDQWKEFRVDVPAEFKAKLKELGFSELRLNEIGKRG
jgi:23S rRNA pseudouridine1911/1915/1917 synthase